MIFVLGEKTISKGQFFPCVLKMFPARIKQIVFDEISRKQIILDTRSSSHIGPPKILDTSQKNNYLTLPVTPVNIKQIGGNT